MIFTSLINQLQDPVNKVSLAIPTKTIDPRFENIHLSVEPGNLTLFGTDGDISITATTDIDSSETAYFGINAKILQDFLRSMYNTSVTFTLGRQDISEHGIVTIATDKGKYRITCLFEGKTERFDKNYCISLEFETIEFLDLIQKTVFACSVDGMRPAMMGVLFELENNIITAVSTDGHRLVRCRKNSSLNVSEKQKVVVPARVLSILQKLAQHESLTMCIDADHQFVRFIVGNIILDAALILEPYPNYDAVIPVEHDKHVIIDRSIFYDSVRRVARFSDIGDIKIIIESTSVKVVAENANDKEAAQEELACDYIGEEIVIGFNAKFIEAALSHLDDQKICIELKSSTTAVIFKPYKEIEDDKLIILVMPVRINNYG